jgi:hypothetical protein
VTGQPGTAEADAIFTKPTGTTYTTPMAPLDETQVIRGNNIEWIVERLLDTNRDGMLLNFGTILFSSCSGSTQATAASSFPRDGEAIDMFNTVKGIAASTAIDTNGNGDSFTVTWATSFT